MLHDLTWVLLMTVFMTLCHSLSVSHRNKQGGIMRSQHLLNFMWVSTLLFASIANAADHIAVNDSCLMSIHGRVKLTVPIFS